MTKTDRKILDRLIAAERMNLIYEAKIKRVSELIWKTEREEAEYLAAHSSYKRTLDNVNIRTREIREAIGIESELSTVELFDKYNSED